MNAAIEWANGLAGHWAHGMWPVLWQTAALAAIVGLIVLCNRRMSPALKFWLWMLVPLRLLVMPLIVIALPVLPNPPAVYTQPAAAPTRFISQAHVEAQALDSTVRPEPPSISIQRRVRPSIWTWLMAGWFAGIGFFALRLARGWLRMKEFASQAHENTDARVRDCAREAAAMLGLRKIPRILSAAEGVSPFVLGFFRPVVVLPAVLADHVTPEELRAVLAHEFAHVRRRDALAGWVLACSDVIYFFNPIAHLVKRAIIFERERACDEQVLALAQAPSSVYARALLTATGLTRPTAARLTCAPVLLESGQHLERRLKSIADERRPRAALSRTAKLCLLLVAVLALPGITCTHRSTKASAIFADSLTQTEDINAKVAKLNLEKASREDVVAVFGEPTSYVWGDKTFTKDKLPEAYIMVYRNLLNVEMFGGQVEELRFGEGNGPSDYVFGDGLRVGSSLQEALKVIGPPDKTVEGSEIGFVDGVLYRNSHFTDGTGRSNTATYYARRSQGIRIFALRGVVTALYLTRKDPPSVKPKGSAEAVATKAATIPTKAEAPSAPTLPADDAAFPLDQKIWAVSVSGYTIRDAVAQLCLNIKGASYAFDPDVASDQTVVMLKPMKDVTLAQALDILLKERKLDYVFSDNVIYVSTKEGCAAYARYADPATTEGQASRLQKDLNSTLISAYVPDGSVAQEIQSLKKFPPFKDLPITLDPAVLAKADRMRVSFELHDVPMRVLLKNILAPYGLYYAVIDDGIYIFTEANLSLRQYDVSDFLTRMDGKKLLELIVARTGQGNWGVLQASPDFKSALASNPPGYPAGILWLRTPWLMANNLDPVHKKIEAVLRELREAQSGSVESKGAATAATP